MSNNEDKELTDLFKDCNLEDFTLTPAYIPYSYFRAKNLLKEEFGIDMITRQGYKIDRYRGHRTYRLVWIATGEVINCCIDLYQIRCFLSNYRFPLLENEETKKARNREKQAQKRSDRLKERNPKADLFLQIVNDIPVVSESEDDI